MRARIPSNAELTILNRAARNRIVFHSRLSPRLCRKWLYLHMSEKGSQGNALANKHNTAVIHLRPERAEDDAFLFALFCASREAEFAALPLSQRKSLLRFQYQAQSRDYAARFPHSQHSIVEFGGQAAGRLLLNREADEIRVADIAIVPELQRRGIASDVLRSLISEAEDNGMALRLSVWRSNPALALYRQLGFCVRAESATHLELEWRPHLD